MPIRPMNIVIASEIIEELSEELTVPVGDGTTGDTVDDTLGFVASDSRAYANYLEVSVNIPVKDYFDPWQQHPIWPSSTETYE